MDRVSEKGFTKSVVIVEGLDEFLGHRVKILAKNENYIIRYLDSSSAAKLKDGPVLACTPDLICAIDSDEGAYIRTCTMYLLTYIAWCNVRMHAALR